MNSTHEKLVLLFYTLAHIDIKCTETLEGFFFQE